MSMISLQDVCKAYPGNKHEKQSTIQALSNVSLEIPAGSIFGIIGYSGAGKSTLVRLINALESATSGSIVVDGAEIVGASEKQLRQLRTEIGMIFQQFNLFSSRTVAGNVEFPLKVAGVPAAQRANRIQELLNFVGLSDRADAFPEQLSGGQKQRVGIARALATNPKILLADEATSALDPQTTTDVLELLARVNREFGITIVAITHEMEVVKDLATHVAVMENGAVVETGKVADVFSNPRHPTTKSFVRSVIPGAPQGAELERLRATHAGELITVSLSENGRGSGEIMGHLLQPGLLVELVYGSVQNVGGRTLGHLTFALHGEPGKIAAAKAAVAKVAKVQELIGEV